MSRTHSEGEFEGEKGLDIYYQFWLPESPKAIVQIVHGFGEHSARYENVIEKLLPRGFAIYADDHRGHGKSEGVTNYVDSFDLYVEDERILYGIIRENHPDLPIFMLGHSMGSGIAMYFTKRYEDLLKGLILSGTGTSTGGEVSGFLKFMSKILSVLAKKLTIDPKLDPETLSHDPNVVKAYKEDPLVHHDVITARLGYEMIKYFGKAPEVVKDLKLPILVQRGTADEAMGGFNALKQAFTTNDLTIHEYEGLYHEIYNEVKEDREKVINDLLEWIENHV
ncbi:MAG: alpha/beta hydrolase [Promethearchaeia archaeon]